MKQVHIPTIYRTARIEEGSINEQERTVEIVWSTGARRVTWSWTEWEQIEEELDLAGADLSRLNNGAPFLKDHAYWSIDNVLGVHVDGSVVVDAAIGVGRAKIRFDTDPEIDKYFKKVVNRILRQTSVGYNVHKYIVTREEGKLPLYRAVEWTPFENSLVTIGADPGAQVQRSDAQPKLFGCTLLYQNRNTTTPPRKEITMGKNKPQIPNQNQKRAMSDDIKGKCKEILKEYAVAEDKLDEAVDKIAALWPEETKDGGSGEMSAVAKALGCREGASSSEVVKAATNLRTLADSLEEQLEDIEETKEEDEFEVNEKKGLHRNLARVGPNFARQLFESNIALYREKVGKVTPLDGNPPEAKAETRKTLAAHEAETKDDAMADAVAREEKRLLEADPKLSAGEAYKRAFKNVREQKQQKRA